MTTPIDAQILEGLSNEVVETNAKRIIELAAEAWPLDVGSFLAGLGVGQMVATGKSDAEVMAIVAASLEKLRAFMRALVEAEGAEPS